jgi:copper homeostasis protein (lipoprotein)
VKLTCCYSIALAIVVAAANSAAAQSVQGTATYPERMVWPPTAVFEALVEDIFDPDAPEVIGRVRMANQPNPPILFEIPYDRARIQSDHVYGVSARILVGERVIFATDTYSVITRGSDDLVTLMIYPVTTNQDQINDQDQIEPSPAALPSLGSLPATFGGSLPCADCPGIYYQLNLFPDGVFVARSTYQERGIAVDDMGRWVLSSDGRVVVLKGANDQPVMFAIRDDDTLVMLGAEGDETESTFDDAIRRSVRMELIEPRLNLSGMYRYIAEAGMFTECMTGWRLLVAEKRESDALETAYARRQQQPGEELKARVDGRLVVRPHPDTGVEQRMLVVERFIDMMPGETCGAPFSALPLENTYWRATQLEGQPVPPSQPGGQAYLMFEAGRVSGSDGCNRVASAYELNHDSISFGPMAATRMACSGTADIERAFGNAVANASSWRILGDRLELYDANGVRLARFEPGITGSQ